MFKKCFNFFWIASCLIFLFSVKRKQLFVMNKITILPKDNLRDKIIIKAASEVRVQKFRFENEERLTSSMDDGYI